MERGKLVFLRACAQRPRPNEGTRRGFISSRLAQHKMPGHKMPGTRCWRDRLSRRSTLLSFQGPNHPQTTQKSLRLTPEASERSIQRSYPLARRRSSRRVTGFLRRPIGRPEDGIRRVGGVNQAVVTARAGSVRGDTGEAPLAGLHDGSRERVPGKVEFRHGLPVDSDAALRDQPARLARGHAEPLG